MCIPIHVEVCVCVHVCVCVCMCKRERCLLEWLRKADSDTWGQAGASLLASSEVLGKSHSVCPSVSSSVNWD